VLTVEKVMVLKGVDIFNDVPTALLASFASAFAVDDTLLLCLDKDHFDLFVTDHPQLSGSVIRYLVRFIRASTRRDVSADT
jgi:CRP-like cAMP-binding protein